MPDLQQNKDTVTAYYQTAFGGDPVSAVELYMGATYTQHHPEAADGPDAFIGFVRALRAEHPDLVLEIKQTIAEGDLVMTHSDLILEPGEPGLALTDIFRLDAGKVVEHWDVIQPVPTTVANLNGMF